MATATVTMSVADTSFFGDSLGSHSETVKIRYPCHYRDKPPKSIVCVSSLGEKLEAACTIQSVDFKACEYEFLSEEEANNIIATRLQDVENNLNRQFDKIGNDINSQVTTSLNKLNESWNSPEKKREMKELVDAKLSELVPTIKEEFRSVINEELSKFKTAKSQNGW
jgi:DNA-directed RNA polymerase subunit F